MQRRLTYYSATTVPVIQPPTPSSGVTASPPAEPSARGHPGRPGPQNPPVEGGVREGRERGAITQLFGSAWGSKSSCGRRTSKGHYTVIRVGVCLEGVGLQRMYTGNTPISVGTYSSSLRYLVWGRGQEPSGVERLTSFLDSWARLLIFLRSLLEICKSVRVGGTVSDDTNATEDIGQAERYR